MNSLVTRIFSIRTPADFIACTLEVFRFQSLHCGVYREYLSLLGVDPLQVVSVDEIPFLPIAFFKTREIVSNRHPVQAVFTSSGTTGVQVSRHYVTDLKVYEKSFSGGFTYFYGPPADYTLLALLPAYLEREGSSLVYMVEKLMQQSAQPDNGFYLYDFEALHAKLVQIQTARKNVIVIGVSYALIDFAEKFPLSFPELIVMETGGMKGKRAELPKPELHRLLCSGFGVNKIHSEYGMTELLSQAYSKGDGRFYTPPWMQVRIRDPRDPFAIINDEAVGGVNIIDLANLHSCAFIETQDMGKRYNDGSFEITGRFVQSDVRGCNLMYDG